MTQISVLQGILTNSQGVVVDGLPVNLEPTIINSGISEGYLSNIPGITLFAANSSGIDRCAINWNGTMYRVQDQHLISVDKNGHIVTLGSVGNNGVTAFMDYGFNQLAIASNGLLWYYDGTALTQVTDPLAVNVNDVIWVDGYFMFTDGANIVVTTLADPYIILPFNYGTAEIDPDPILGLIKLRDEVYAMGRYTIQNFQNIGGSGFPFQTNDSAFIPKGVVGVKSFCVYKDVLAFVGSGRNEDISIYLGASGETTPIVSNQISKILQDMSAADQTLIELETIVTDNEFRLLVHLPDQTLVYYWNASQAAQSPIWTIHKGGILADQPYPIRHFVYAYNKFIGASPDAGKMGYLDTTVSTQFGIPVGWEFETIFIYNKGGFTITDLELIAVTGRVALGVNPTISFSYSRDGIFFSQERFISQGTIGQSTKRLAWRPMCNSTNYMNLRFKGVNTSISTIMRLEANIEGQLA